MNLIELLIAAGGDASAPSTPSAEEAEALRERKRALKAEQTRVRLELERRNEARDARRRAMGRAGFAAAAGI